MLRSAPPRRRRQWSSSRRPVTVARGRSRSLRTSTYAAWASPVAAFWGDDIAESEWSWVIARGDVATLARALGVEPDGVLGALAERFSGAALAGLRPFLDAAGVPVASWSRLGD